MTEPPGQAADVTSGTVYRRIPNRDVFFDYDEGVVEPALFIPRPRDHGALSAHLDQSEADAQLSKPPHIGFGLCAIDISTMLRETAGRIRVKRTPTAGSRSHVSILGCTDDEIAAYLAAMAEVIHQPAKPWLPH